VNLFPWFLFAHILGAVIAFGPTFTFPIIGRLGGQERIHANFATRVSYAISHVQVTPFAILQGITGVGLVITGSIDVFKAPWLIVGIVLYLVALGYAIFVQTPTVRRVIDLTTMGGNGHAGSAPRPAGPPTATDGAPPAGPGAGGPPPELMGLIRRIQTGGLFLAALIVAIVFLMVVKPSL
jgi:uncharacterized membrane protein